MTRSILITGASRGIGRASAWLHAEREGAELWLLGRDRVALEETAAGVVARGGTAHVLVADLMDRAALKAVAREVPRLDGLIASAGLAGDTPVDEDCDDLFDTILGANLTASWNIVRAFLPVLAPGCRVVFVSSVLGRYGVPRAAAYVAAKHALLGLTKSLALELLPRGITVNAVAPNWVETDMAESRVAQIAASMGVDPATARTRLARAVPIGRFFQPQEIAEGIGWMMNPLNSTQLGQCLNLDGGGVQD